MTNQTFAYNPEIKGQMGLELPQLDTNFREAFEKPMAILGTVASLAGGIAVGVNSLSHPEKANAGVEICTTPTGEAPIPNPSPAHGGVDLAIDSIASSNLACEGSYVTYSTNIRNVGTADSGATMLRIFGKQGFTSSIGSVNINGEEWSVKRNYTPTGFNMEKVCQEASGSSDIYGNRTKNIACGDYYYMSVLPGANIPISFKVLSRSNPGEGGEYVEVSAFNSANSETTSQFNINNISRRDIFVNSSTGEPLTPNTPITKCPTRPAFNSVLNKDSTVSFYFKPQKGQTIYGTRNLKLLNNATGRSKIPRIEYVPAKSVNQNLLPAFARKVGKKVVVAVTGVSKSDRYKGVKLKYPPKKGTYAKLILPRNSIKNTIGGCPQPKLGTIYAQNIQSKR